jgi:hypothetical protein
MRATPARAETSDSNQRDMNSLHAASMLSFGTRVRSLALDEQDETLAEPPTEREPRRRIAQPADGKLRPDSLPTVRQPPKEGRPNPPVAW